MNDSAEDKKEGAMESKVRQPHRPNYINTEVQKLVDYRNGDVIVSVPG